MQADLFQVPSAASSMTAEPRESILDKFRISLRLDQALMVLISLVMVYVVVFSFGFEKGKRSASRDFQRQEARKARTVLSQTAPKSDVVMIDASRLPASGVITAGQAAAVVTAQTEALTVPAVQEPDTAVKPAVLKAGKGKFTIQLATFKTQPEADRFVKKLADQGYRGFSQTQGKFRVVFANDFESRSVASSVLKDLVSKGLAPKDAYVRNMPKLG